MRLRGKRHIKSWACRTVAPFRSRVAVLLYHRIFEPQADPWDLSVSPANFEEHLACLSKNFNVYSLSEFADRLAKKKLSRRAVVITFDDGYLDNFLHAKPLLEKYELPATIFVTSGTIDSGREFWWDSLERILLLDAKIPTRLELDVDGRKYTWSTKGAAECVQTFWSLHPILQALPPAKREQAMATLLEWAGIDEIGRSDYRPMTKNELLELGRSPYIEIGGHTVTHSSLSDLSHQEQLQEMADGRKALEGWLGTKVNTLAYPYGRYSADSVELAAKAGFDLAFTVEPKWINTKKNPLRLGRFGVENWNGKEFKCELDQFFLS